MDVPRLCGCGGRSYASRVAVLNPSPAQPPARVEYLHTTLSARSLQPDIVPRTLEAFSNHP